MMNAKLTGVRTSYRRAVKQGWPAHPINICRTPAAFPTLTAPVPRTPCPDTPSDSHPHRGFAKQIKITQILRCGPPPHPGPRTPIH
ncbi:hypothetical protein FIBSPDRAFT_239292 [Athelia psychrophila]|uniref:Uncharacterized protein n=1 Tax=Athelia psychrophila TaxID=1759441 RepID=A0A165YES1_9AGAM|nr:hypothetical protein FIBSPDRAFT_239292 [Fibularhizoctonia sp. CBS 109695]